MAQIANTLCNWTPVPPEKSVKCPVRHLDFFRVCFPGSQTPIFFFTIFFFGLDKLRISKVTQRQCLFSLVVCLSDFLVP